MTTDYPDAVWEPTLHPGSVRMRVWYASSTDVFVPDGLVQRLSLSIDESCALEHALTSYLSDLRMEISGTDNAQMRRELRSEERLLNAIRVRLSEPAVSPA
jgi:hypothetical protein